MQQMILADSISNLQQTYRNVNIKRVIVAIFMFKCLKKL